MSIGKIVGVIVFAGATAAIWLWPEGAAPEAPEAAVRPVRSAVIGGDSALPELRFAGKIKADASRTLRFKQSGRIEKIPVGKGQKVKRGEKLAWLFGGDFRNRLEEATANAERCRLTSRRVSDAAKKNAVSQEEVSKAETQLRQAEANLELAKRAYDETFLLAPFDGTIADVPATELDMVSSADPILVLQDMSKIKIDVAVPETIVILQKKIRYVNRDGRCHIDVVFDSLPGRKFPVQFVEYTATADQSTQTYTATYVMEPVPDVLLLPGMSATIVIPAGSYYFDEGTAEAKRIDIPESAVGVDGKGGYFVWKLVQEGDAYVARKTPITGSFLKGDKMSVKGGIAVGDRVATAGVAVLTEGRKVTLLED